MLPTPQKSTASSAVSPANGPSLSVIKATIAGAPTTPIPAPATTSATSPAPAATKATRRRRSSKRLGFQIRICIIWRFIAARAVCCFRRWHTVTLLSMKIPDRGRRDWMVGFGRIIVRFIMGLSRQRIYITRSYIVRVVGC